MKPRALPTWQASQIRTLGRCARAETSKRKRYLINTACRTCGIHGHTWHCDDVLVFLAAHVHHRTHLRFYRAEDPPPDPGAVAGRAETQTIAMCAALTDGGKVIADLASAAGISIPSARRRVRELVAAGQIVRVDGGRRGQQARYALPERDQKKGSLPAK